MCARIEVLGYYMLHEHPRDEGLAWEVSLQGLDVTSGKLVNGATKECENPLIVCFEGLPFLILRCRLVSLLLDSMIWLCKYATHFPNSKSSILGVLTFFSRKMNLTHPWPWYENILFYFLGIQTSVFEYITSPVSTLGLYFHVIICLGYHNRWTINHCPGLSFHVPIPQ